MVKNSSAILVIAQKLTREKIDLRFTKETSTRNLPYIIALLKAAANSLERREISKCTSGFTQGTSPTSASFALRLFPQVETAMIIRGATIIKSKYLKDKVLNPFDLHFLKLSEHETNLY